MTESTQPTTTTAPKTRSAAQRWHRLTVLSWLTLIALLLVWHQRIPTTQPMVSLILALLPLLLPAVSLLRGQRGALLALAVIALLYFCHAIVALTAATGETLWAVAELLVSICLFVSSTLTARLLR